MISQTILLYVLKSIFISGIFLGYYWIALRNKSFNYYNRFYLLLSIACSMVIPFFNFNWFTIEQQDLPVSPETLNFISTQIVHTSSTTISWQDLTFYAVAGISLFLLIMFALNILKVYKLKRQSAIVKMDNVDFIYTSLDHAPFSFLNNLFWKESIPLDDEYGQKIFKHEITHIQQKHTLDVLFCQVINAIFWMNPFNWLIQKELKSVHEFIADKEALGNNDVEAFVKLLLQVHYGKHFLNPTHAFYYSSIKRRLFMLTTTTRARFSHVRKLLLLPVGLLVVITMSVSTIESKATTIISPIITAEPVIVAPTISTEPVIVAVQKPVSPARVKHPVKRVHRNDTTPAKPATIKKNEEMQPQPEISGYSEAGVIIHMDTTKKGPLPDAVYYIDNKLATKVGVQKLKPDQIRSIHVWKGEDAVKKFGLIGSKGVIEVFTKVTP